ncbi:MAG: ostA-like family protein [Cyanobacteria bacterium RI_101]|nr:ostA-like family protein [Cyanobacteria bacterium RI_101]
MSFRLSRSQIRRFLPLLLLAWAGLTWSARPWRSVQAQTAPSSPMTVRSDIQEANSQTGVVTARGNVQVYYPARKMQATAVQAQYFSRERRLVLSGNVYVLQDGNSMRAETMTYLIDEGRFVANPQVSQQVESIYLVQESEESRSGGAPVGPRPLPEDALPPLPPLNSAP